MTYIFYKNGNIKTLNKETILQSDIENPLDITSVIIDKNTKTIGDHAFYLCTSLENLTICHGVSNIEIGAFYGCNSLKEIIIPESIKNIRCSAFYGCHSLNKVVILGKTNIDQDAFFDCFELTLVFLPKKSTQYVLDHKSIGFGQSQNNDFSVKFYLKNNKVFDL